MIVVRKNPQNPSLNNQKLIGTFLKRVKKSGLVARKRKTSNWKKPISARNQKAKALRIAEYNHKLELLERLGKVK